MNGIANIWIVDADGTNQKQLTLAGNNYDPSVCRTGRMLAYLSDRNGSPAIWTMDIDGGNPVMVVKACRGHGCLNFHRTGNGSYTRQSGSGQWTNSVEGGVKGRASDRVER